MHDLLAKFLNHFVKTFIETDFQHPLLLQELGHTHPMSTARLYEKLQAAISCLCGSHVKPPRRSCQ